MHFKDGRVFVSADIGRSPVGLKEAALDSPTFRSGFTHFAEQIEFLEKWLHGYYRCVSKLAHEVAPFETLMNNFLQQTIPPTYVSEAVLDHDYTLLAIQRYGEGAREFWAATISGLKKMGTNMVEPIKEFLHSDMQNFKYLKRNLEAAQKQLDSLQSRFASQARSKEPSSLREDAFQLHEARKAYLKLCMDFSVAAPQLRMNLDKLLVKVFSDQWHDIRDPRFNISSSIGKWGADIERVRGWSREMENGEKAFRRELQDARKQIEESAEASVRPSRELEDYAIESSSVSKQKGPLTSTMLSTGTKTSSGRAEKQGWLNLRTVTGKPSRTVWVRRWFYVKNGIFGWLVQGSRSGAVEESDRIGVLLCNIKASSSDDRRYVFEVKTKDTTIVTQAETQPELNEWLSTFELAKSKALEDPASTYSTISGALVQDPAFAISPPSAPEFAANLTDSGMPQSNDDASSSLGVDRSSTLPIPGAEIAARSSFDVNSTRRSAGQDTSSEQGRDPASRLISKLDLHRKQAGGLNPSSPTSSGSSGGGIASLIAASHGSMPVGPGAIPVPSTPDGLSTRKVSTPLSLIREMPISSLAPNTLANPPAPTNLSTTAVIVNGERGVGLGRPDATGGVPSGLLANVWGSSNWGFLNRLERGEVIEEQQAALATPTKPGNNENSNMALDSFVDNDPPVAALRTTPRRTLSLEGTESSAQPTLKAASSKYPSCYPLQLKTQDAQFRLLFPNVPREEKVVLVFKATWNPNDQQDFPGRVYVTPKEIYFYSNHCGMTMTTSLRLDSIGEVTAASGRDWDVVFLHLKESTEFLGYSRITIKTFLEPLKLLQRRLSFLVKTASADSLSTEDIMKNLIKIEHDGQEGSPGENDRENTSVNTSINGGSIFNRQLLHKDQRDLRTNVLIDRGLYGDSQEATKPNKLFKLPKQPVVFVPSNMDELAAEKEFEISPKALFHVLFGDKSAVWQLLYHERQAQREFYVPSPPISSTKADVP